MGDMVGPFSLDSITVQTTHTNAHTPSHITYTFAQGETGRERQHTDTHTHYTARLRVSGCARERKGGRERKHNLCARKNLLLLRTQQGLVETERECQEQMKAHGALYTHAHAREPKATSTHAQRHALHMRRDYISVRCRRLARTIFFYNQAHKTTILTH